MAEIINLRMARKQKARATREAEAAGNRILYGRSKAERQASRLEQQRAASELDGKKRETSPQARQEADTPMAGTPMAGTPMAGTPMADTLAGPKPAGPKPEPEA